jgi:hypothetical protein
VPSRADLTVSMTPSPPAIPPAQGRAATAIALLASWLGYGFTLALVVAFLLPLRTAYHVAELTLWAGPMSASLVLIATFATRRRRGSMDWRLARIALATIFLGPPLWIALFASRLA